MVELNIENELKTSQLGPFVGYLNNRDFNDTAKNPLSLKIKKKGDDLIVTVEGGDIGHGILRAKSYHLSYKVKGLKDLIVSFLNGYTITDLDTKLSNYTKTTDLDTKLSNYTKTTDLDTKLSNYTKTTDLDTKLSNYTETADLNTNLGNYTKTADLNTKLNDYIKTTDLDTKLSNYAKTDGSNMTEDIQNKLMGHHAAQVFDFLSSLETEYNAMHG